jgi:hypothetical protein
MTSILKPWFGVATPHEDIRRDRLSEAVFAANLWAVVQGDAPKSAEIFREQPGKLIRL